MGRDEVYYGDLPRPGIVTRCPSPHNQGGRVKGKMLRIDPNHDGTFTRQEFEANYPTNSWRKFYGRYSAFYWKWLRMRDQRCLRDDPDLKKLTRLASGVVYMRLNKAKRVATRATNESTDPIDKLEQLRAEMRRNYKPVILPEPEPVVASSDDEKSGFGLLEAILIGANLLVWGTVIGLLLRNRNNQGGDGDSGSLPRNNTRSQPPTPTPVPAPQVAPPSPAVWPSPVPQSTAVQPQPFIDRAKQAAQQIPAIPPRRNASPSPRTDAQESADMSGEAIQLSPPPRRERIPPPPRATPSPHKLTLPQMPMVEVQDSPDMDERHRALREQAGRMSIAKNLPAGLMLFDPQTKANVTIGKESVNSVNLVVQGVGGDDALPLLYYWFQKQLREKTSFLDVIGFVHSMQMQYVGVRDRQSLNYMLEADERLAGTQAGIAAYLQLDGSVHFQLAWGVPLFGAELLTAALGRFWETVATNRTPEADAMLAGYEGMFQKLNAMDGENEIPPHIKNGTQIYALGMSAVLAALKNIKGELDAPRIGMTAHNVHVQVAQQMGHAAAVTEKIEGDLEEGGATLLHMLDEAIKKNDINAAKNLIVAQAIRVALPPVSVDNLFVLAGLHGIAAQEFLYRTLACCTNDTLEVKQGLEAIEDNLSDILKMFGEMPRDPLPGNTFLFENVCGRDEVKGYLERFLVVVRRSIASFEGGALHGRVGTIVPGSNLTAASIGMGMVGGMMSITPFTTLGIPAEGQDVADERTPLMIREVAGRLHVDKRFRAGIKLTDSVSGVTLVLRSKYPEFVSKILLGGIREDEVLPLLYRFFQNQLRTVVERNAQGDSLHAAFGETLSQIQWLNAYYAGLNEKQTADVLGGLAEQRVPADEFALARTGAYLTLDGQAAFLLSAGIPLFRVEGITAALGMFWSTLARYKSDVPPQAKALHAKLLIGLDDMAGATGSLHENVAIVDEASHELWNLMKVAAAVGGDSTKFNERASVFHAKMGDRLREIVTLFPETSDDQNGQVVEMQSMMADYLSKGDFDAARSSLNMIAMRGQLGNVSGDNIKIVAGVHSLAAAELRYRAAVCETDAVQQRKHLMVARRQLLHAQEAFSVPEDPVRESMLGMTILAKNPDVKGRVVELGQAIDASIAVCESGMPCEPAGIFVSGYGYTSASLERIGPNAMRIVPLTPIKAVGR